VSNPTNPDNRLKLLKKKVATFEMKGGQPGHTPANPATSFPHPAHLIKLIISGD
jgi:hypothetical protein